MKSYHGPLPVTPKDKVMAKQHLNATKTLLQSKIKDHAQAKATTPDPKSKAYNQSHLISHKKDLQEVNNSLRTLQASKGLAAYIKQKKS